MQKRQWYQFTGKAIAYLGMGLGCPFIKCPEPRDQGYHLWARAAIAASGNVALLFVSMLEAGGRYSKEPYLLFSDQKGALAELRQIAMDRAV